MSYVRFRYIFTYVFSRVFSCLTCTDVIFFSVVVVVVPSWSGEVRGEIPNKNYSEPFHRRKMSVVISMSN